MRAIILDDEPLMIKSFMRLSQNIKDLNVTATFEYAEDVIEYAETHSFEIAFLDIEVSDMSGIECARILKEKMPELLVVFISAYDDYIRDSNQLGGDDYILKPYNEEILEKTMKKMRLLVRRQKKSVYIQMFGRFVVMKDGVPIKFNGKAKEILACILVRRGREISNEEIYSTLWEQREYSNDKMKVYYNALKRLKDHLKEHGLENLIFSTSRGQIANVEMFDCDYYSWLDGNSESEEEFKDEFLTEYSWGEYILGNLVHDRAE